MGSSSEPSVKHDGRVFPLRLFAASVTAALGWRDRCWTKMRESARVVAAEFYFCTKARDLEEPRRCLLGHIGVVDEAEIKRLRRPIQRSYGSSPHKKKCWLALLEMFAGATTVRRGRQKEAKGSSVPKSSGERIRRKNPIYHNGYYVYFTM